MKISREKIDLEWNEKEDGPHPTEIVYYIETLDGRTFRWANASFIRVPTTAKLDIAPFGEAA